MLNPERQVLEDLLTFLEEESLSESSGTGRSIIYEEVIDKIAELKLDLSREYNLPIP